MSRYQNLHLADKSLFTQYRTLFKTDIDSAHAVLNNQSLNNKKFQAADINGITSDVSNIENYYFENIPDELDDLYDVFNSKIDNLHNISAYDYSKTYNNGDIVLYGADWLHRNNNTLLYIAERTVPSTETETISGYNPYNLVYICSGNEQVNTYYSMVHPYIDNDYFYFTLSYPFYSVDLICFDTGSEEFLCKGSVISAQTSTSIVGTLLTFTEYWKQLALCGSRGYGGMDINLTPNTDLDPFPFTETYNGTFERDYTGWDIGSSLVVSDLSFSGGRGLSVIKDKESSGFASLKIKQDLVGYNLTSDWKKYYGCVDILVNTTQQLIINQYSYPIIGIGYNGSYSYWDKDINGDRQSELIDGNWHTLYFYTEKQYSGFFLFGIYADANNGTQIAFKNAKLFNLTEIYGSGLEPTESWCNTNLAPLTSVGYDWDSSITYNAKDAVIYNNNIYVAKSTNQGENPETSTTYWLQLVNDNVSGINLDNSSLETGDIYWETIT